MIALLREAAATCLTPPAPLWLWSLTEGMRRDGDPSGAQALGPRAALDFIAAYDGPAVFLLADFHEPMREAPDVRRRVRDLYDVCFGRGKFVVRFFPKREMADRPGFERQPKRCVIQNSGTLRKPSPTYWPKE